MSSSAGTLSFIAIRRSQTRDSGLAAAVGVAVLAALNIADDFFQLREARDNIYNQMEMKSESLIQLINEIGRTENPCDVRD